MRLLVTGATGFVGRTTVPYLFGKGFDDICLLVRNVSKALELFGDLPLKVISTSDADWREAVIEYAPEATLHLAAFFSGRDDAATATELVESNIMFTTLLLEALSKTGCKTFINIGTFTEFLYGAGEYRPNNLYSATKTAERPIISYFQSLGGWRWINTVVYSPYGRRNDSKKVMDYLADAVGAEEPVAFSGGEQILDFIHVDDMADFFATLLSRLDSLPMYQQFHLGTGRGVSLREAARVMERVFGDKANARWGELPYRKNDPMFAVAPVAANIELLNWRARISLEDGLAIFKEDLGR